MNNKKAYIIIGLILLFSFSSKIGFESYCVIDLDDSTELVDLDDNTGEEKEYQLAFSIKNFLKVTSANIAVSRRNKIGNESGGYVFIYFIPPDLS